MTDPADLNRARSRSRKGVRRSGRRIGGNAWRHGHAARFLFKGQCYDAAPDSETRCGLCGERIRLCYVLKVLETTDLLSPEIDKFTIGECCFKPIKSANDKLYCQLLAAAINLRMFMEAIQRDKQVFAGGLPDKVEPLPVALGEDEALAWQMPERIVAEGGDHAWPGLSIPR